jgi:single-strand DNA-binding protein
MASFNKVYLMGNLTRDPEVRTTPSGLKIAKLGLAVNRRYKTRENETKEETTYVDIDAFGAQAEVLEKYCQKGSPLFIEGRLRLEQWQNSNGENRSKLSIVLENFQFIGGRGDSASSESSGSYENTSETPPTGESTGGNFEEDDDIPF